MAFNFFEKASRALRLTASDRLIHAESNLMLYEFVARRLDLCPVSPSWTN